MTGELAIKADDAPDDAAGPEAQSARTLNIDTGGSRNSSRALLVGWADFAVGWAVVSYVPQMATRVVEHPSAHGRA